jgi:hypothetical protein
MLHLSRTAKGLPSLDRLQARLDGMVDRDLVVVPTRFLPKRQDEVAGTGSLYWIVRNHFAARSPIAGFGQMPDGRGSIILSRDLIRVRSAPRRAHQGWRYLDPDDAPPDLSGEDGDVELMPPELLRRLTALALI